jgi:hypothetical protein
MSDQLERLTAALADRYRIDRELGAGGMATVYLAEDLKHNRKVAVKVLKPELAVAIGAERFLAEIKTTANLQHPHILALHVCANEPKHAVRCYVRPLSNGTFRPFTSEGVSSAVASPDGESIVAMTNDGYQQFLIRDGASQRVAGVTLNDQIIRYSPDGRFLWTRRLKSQPVHIEQIDIKTGARTALLPDFSQPRAGVLGAAFVTLADDPHTYAYIEREAASYLFELKGAK